MNEKKARHMLVIADLREMETDRTLCLPSRPSSSTEWAPGQVRGCLRTKGGWHLRNNSRDCPPAYIPTRLHLYASLQASVHRQTHVHVRTHTHKFICVSTLCPAWYLFVVSKCFELRQSAGGGLKKWGTGELRKPCCQFWGPVCEGDSDLVTRCGSAKYLQGLVRTGWSCGPAGSYCCLNYTSSTRCQPLVLCTKVTFQDLKVWMWNFELHKLSAFRLKIRHPGKEIRTFQFVSPPLPTGTHWAPERQRLKWLDIAKRSEEGTSSKQAAEKASPLICGCTAVQWSGEAVRPRTLILIFHDELFFFLNRAVVLKIVLGSGGFLRFSRVPSHFLYFCFKRGALSSFGFYQIIHCAKASISRTDGPNVHENTCLLKKLNW